MYTLPETCRDLRGKKEIPEQGNHHGVFLSRSRLNGRMAENDRLNAVLFAGFTARD